jgi:hypothetical protein
VNLSNVTQGRFGPFYFHFGMGSSLGWSHD